MSKRNKQEAQTETPPPQPPADPNATDPVSDGADRPAPASKPPALVGFLAISGKAGQRGSEYPARMHAYPIAVGFDWKQPLRDLNAQRAKPGDWQGYAVLFDPEIDRAYLEPVELGHPVDEPTKEG